MMQDSIPEEFKDLVREARKHIFQSPRGHKIHCPLCRSHIKEAKFVKHLVDVHSGGRKPKVKVRRVKSTDALNRSSSGGLVESKRRKH
jgi:hypothetical protein